MKVVPVVSGGLDSVTMLYLLHEQDYGIEHIVSFNYGQRHKKELDFAKYHADSLGAEHIIIDLYRTSLTHILAQSGSSLVDDTVDVPEGHYAEENMKATVVPNRNMMMLAIAGSVAVATGAEYIATAVHSGDHAIYPDCRPEFVDLLERALWSGNEGFGSLAPNPIKTPFLYRTKADIAEMAMQLHVPIDKTWSCYVGGAKHCGRCGTCVERLEAIDGARSRFAPQHRIIDETEYEDTTYWREALKKELA
jgi:7-cyano-7-deazaguanine synthase